MVTPLGNNSLNSFGIFVQREFYQNKIYPDDLPQPIDLWYEKPLYGKVNNASKSVFISEAALKQVKSEDQRIFLCLNFVADAFEDFRRFIKNAGDVGKIDTINSEIKDLEPKLAWTNVNVLYQNYQLKMFEVFRNTFTKELGRGQKINDFNSFAKIFAQFIDLTNPNFPFTRTAFITTKFCPIETSGLSIQIREDNHAMDQTKYEKFIQDKNFNFYVQAARQFGFLIDKNAPWRLVVDLVSSAILPYMMAYSGMKTSKEMFDKYYYQTFGTDLQVLKVYVSQFYNSFVLSEPFLKKTKPGKNGKLITERTERKTIRPEDFDDSFWLRLYTYIRVKETSTKISQSAFERIAREATTIHKNVDNVKAIEYIDSRLNSDHLLSIEEKIENIEKLVSRKDAKSLLVF